MATTTKANPELNQNENKSYKILEDLISINLKEPQNTKESLKSSEKKNRKPLKAIFKYTNPRFIIILFTIILVLTGTSTTSIAILKFNKIGSVQILNSAFTPKPNKVYVNGGALPEFATTINIAGLTEVKLEWDAPFASCKNMFKDLKDVLEIDLSNFDSSLVSDTSSMFQNCNQMTSLNLDNFDTSLVTNMVQCFKIILI